MQCPVCKDATLVMSERSGIEIDYCPQCRGVWLDRGELDKIVERSLQDLSAAAPSAVQASTQQAQPRQTQPHHHDDRYYPDNRQHYKKKKSFWEELFD